MSEAKDTNTRKFDGYENPFAKNLRTLMTRDRKKTTHEELSKALGISRQAVSKYLDGSSQPVIDTLYKIAQYFGVTADYLLGLEEGENHEVSDIASKTGLSVDAVEALIYANRLEEKLSSAEDEYMRIQKCSIHGHAIKEKVATINFLIENCFDIKNKRADEINKLLQHLHNYLFMKYLSVERFAHLDCDSPNHDLEWAISGIVKTYDPSSRNIQTYDSIYVNAKSVSGNQIIRYDMDILSDMHYGSIMSSITELKQLYDKSCEKEDKKGGNHK